MQEDLDSVSSIIYTMQVVCTGLLSYPWEVEAGGSRVQLPLEIQGVPDQPGQHETASQNILMFHYDVSYIHISLHFAHIYMHVHTHTPLSFPSPTGLLSPL